MRIAQVCSATEAVPPRLYGGTERVVHWLIEELVALGNDVTLFASGDSSTSAKLDATWPKALRLDGSVRDPNALHMVMLERVRQKCDDDEFDFLHAWTTTSLERHWSSTESVGAFPAGLAQALRASGHRSGAPDTNRTRELFREPSNELGQNELSLMVKSKSPSIGPMSVQPVEHASTARNYLPTIVSTIGDDKKTPLPKIQQARIEAVRATKARITRRNSLQKQRQALIAGTDACSASGVNCAVEFAKVR